jgi:GTP cyclohydrolase FolE2
VSPFRSVASKVQSERKTGSTATFGIASPSTTKFANLSKTSSEVVGAHRSISSSAVKAQKGDKLRRRREERQRKPVNVDTSIMMFSEAPSSNKRSQSPALMFAAPQSIAYSSKKPTSSIKVF